MVPAPPEAVWALISDPYEVARCVPGATLTGKRDDGSYEGTIVVAFGPTSVTFKTLVTLDLDEAARRGQFLSTARDGKGGTRSKAAVTFDVAPVDGGSSQVAMQGRVDISGPMAGFIESGAAFVVKRIVGETAGRLAERLGRNDGLPTIAAATEATRTEEEPWWSRLLRRLARMFGTAR